MKRSEQLGHYADDVEAFLVAYRALVSRLGPPPAFALGGGSALDGVDDPSTFAMVDAVSEAAGRAHAAVEEAGRYQQIFGRVFDPISDWQNSLRPGHPNDPRLVDTHCQQIIGALRQQAREARSREKGIAGLVARFVRFPSSVREAAGLKSGVGRQSAFVVAVIAQVVATLIAAGVLALVTYAIVHR